VTSFLFNNFHFHFHTSFLLTNTTSPETTIMDDQTQEQNHPTDTIGDQTRDLGPPLLPTTPSTPPTFGARENTDAPPSAFEPDGWLYTKRPGIEWKDAIRQPLHREHAHVTQVSFADSVTFHPDDTRSLATGEPELHPPGTQYSLAMTNRGLDEDGKRLVGFSKEMKSGFIRVSEAGSPEDGVLVRGKEMVLRPVFETPPDQSQNRSQQPPSQSEILSRLGVLLNASLRSHLARGGGERRE
jgi:hypothetical protein